MKDARARTLVIDDDDNVRQLLGEVLMQAGFEVRTAASGASAVELLRHWQFDLAIVDFHMPGGMDGRETLLALKAIDPDIEVIIATGYACDEAAISCLKCGAYDYIQKPFNPLELEHLLGRALERRRLAAASALHECSAELSATMSLPALQGTVVDLALRVLGASAATLVLADDPGGDAELRVLAEVGPVPRVGLLELAGLALDRGEPVLSPSATGQTTALAFDPGADFKSWVALPFLLQKRRMGAIIVFRDSTRLPFNVAEVRRAEMFAQQALMALENHRLYGALSGKVTELSVAHGEAMASNARLRAVLDSAKDGILCMDERGIVLEANASATRMLGADFGCGAALSALLANPQDRRTVRRALDEYIARGTAPLDGRLLETQVRRADGQSFSAEIWIGVAENAGKRTLTAFLRDITDRKKLQMELAHAQKLESVGSLAAGIAHEINTPIQFVGDNTQFLKETFEELSGLLRTYERICKVAHDGPIPPELLAEAREAADQVQLSYLLEEVPKAIGQTLDGVSRVAHIVKAMKNFAHPDGVDKTLTDINKAIESTLTVARNELKYVADVVTHFGDVPLVLCYPGDLNQVLLNLFVNAAHAIQDIVKDSGDRGTIRITTGVEGDELLISIADTGSGIPEEIRARVFDPFFTTKEVGRGTGQGLAIARSIVIEKHAGKLSLESTVGMGTTFHIRLPLAPEAVATA